MKQSEVVERAFAMPLTSPAYPPGPYRFIDREYLIITYRSDPETLRDLVPEPLELAEPTVKFGTLDYNGIRVATGTMGYKHARLDEQQALQSLRAPTFLLKIIPHVDGSPRICELVRTPLADITVKGAWRGPAGLELFDHALAPVARLPVREIVSATHIMTDLTLPLGMVVHDYLT
ncbi:MAG: acetoacetate decarboxylase [Gammaproteobacteria bacterium]